MLETQLLKTKVHLWWSCKGHHLIVSTSPLILDSKLASRLLLPTLVIIGPIHRHCKACPLTLQELEQL